MLDSSILDSFNAHYCGNHSHILITSSSLSRLLRYNKKPAFHYVQVRMSEDDTCAYVFRALTLCKHTHIYHLNIGSHGLFYLLSLKCHSICDMTAYVM